MEFYDFDADTRRVSAKEWSKRKCQTITSSKFWLRRFPLISWLKSYSWTFAFYDVVAGVTVGLLVLPQCLASATVAGLPPQYGLYSSIVGYFLYTALGTCRVINFGPTLLVSMLLRPYTEEFGPEAVVLITFMTGVIITLIAVLQLAPIVEFISYPVLIGFMSAGVVNIILSQAVAMIGIKGSSENVIESIENIVNGIDQFKLWDMVLGITCISILLMILKIGDFFQESSSTDDEKQRSDVLHTIVKYFALCRNALVLAMSMSFVAIMISINGESPVSTPEEIDEGFPPIRLPNFQLQHGNTTLTFGETLSALSSALFVAPLIVLLEFVSVAKAFSNGVSIDTTQEVLTLGLSNTLGSFIQSIPVTGSFTRSAVNDASGVKTPISGVYTGAIVVTVLGLLAHWLTYIPLATLSAVIISALLFLFRIPQVTKECIKSSKRDLIPLYVTFMIGMFVNLTIAIVCGVLVDLIFLIYPAARPNIIIKPTKLPDFGDALLVVPDKNLSYSNVEYFKEQVRNSAAIFSSMDVIAIDGSFIHSVDTTTIKSLKEVLRDFQSKGKKVLFLNWRRSARLGFVKFDGKDAEIFIPCTSQPTFQDEFKSRSNVY